MAVVPHRERQGTTRWLEGINLQSHQRVYGDNVDIRHLPTRSSQNIFWRRVVPFGPGPGCNYVGMQTTNRRPGRPRHRDRTPRVYVGAAMPEEAADAFDAICQAQGKSRAAVVRELVEQTIAANPQLVAGQSPGQEPLIA